MTTLMLAMLGWSVVSFAVAGVWAAVCAGARKGAARNVPAWEQPSRLVAAGFVPAPRAAQIDTPVAV